MTPSLFQRQHRDRLVAMKTPTLNRRHKAVIFATVLTLGLALIEGVSARQSLGIALVGMAMTWAVGSDSRLLHAGFLAVGAVLVAGPMVVDYQQYRESKTRYDLAVSDFEKRLPALSHDNGMTEDWAWAKATMNLAKPADDDADVRVKSFKVANVAELDRLLDHLGYTSSQKEFEEALIRASLVDHTLSDYYEIEALKAPKSQANVVGLIGLVMLQNRGTHFRDPSIYIHVTNRDVSQFFAPVPEWYKDAVAADVNVGALSKDQLPGPAPGAFSVWRSAKNEFMFSLPGAILVCLGLGLLVGVRPSRQTLT